MGNLKYTLTVICLFFGCLAANVVRPDLPIWLIFAVSLIAVISVKAFESVINEIKVEG